METEHPQVCAGGVGDRGMLWWYVATRHQCVRLLPVQLAGLSTDERGLRVKRGFTRHSGIHFGLEACQSDWFCSKHDTVGELGVDEVRLKWSELCAQFTIGGSIRRTSVPTSLHVRAGSWLSFPTCTA